jgi:ribosomal protein S18 acetylase RimI-like enzyme
MTIRPIEPGDEAAVVALWEACGLLRTWNDPHKDIRRKLAVRPEWFLVGVVDSIIVGVVMAGYDGHRGSINYLGVLPEYRRLDYGRTLMAAAEQLLREAGCPKINLMVRTGNQDVIEFYQRLGFTLDDVVCLGKRLEDD